MLSPAEHQGTRVLPALRTRLTTPSHEVSARSSVRGAACASAFTGFATGFFGAVRYFRLIRYMLNANTPDVAAWTTMYPRIAGPCTQTQATAQTTRHTGSIRESGGIRSAMLSNIGSAEGENRVAKRCDSDVRQQVEFYKRALTAVKRTSTGITGFSKLAIQLVTDRETAESGKSADQPLHKAGCLCGLSESSTTDAPDRNVALPSLSFARQQKLCRLTRRTVAGFRAFAGMTTRSS